MKVLQQQKLSESSTNLQRQRDGFWGHIRARRIEPYSGNYSYQIANHEVMFDKGRWVAQEELQEMKGLHEPSSSLATNTAIAEFSEFAKGQKVLLDGQNIDFTVSNIRRSMEGFSYQLEDLAGAPHDYASWFAQKRLKQAPNRPSSRPPHVRPGECGPCVEKHYFRGRNSAEPKFCQKREFIHRYLTLYVSADHER